MESIREDIQWMSNGYSTDDTLLCTYQTVSMREVWLEYDWGTALFVMRSHAPYTLAGVWVVDSGGGGNDSGWIVDSG